VLEQYVKDRLAQRGMLLMTHIVVGHPDFDTSLRLVETMVQAGVDLMELQIPFSEPIADGPVVLRANQEALHGGATVERCFELAFQVARRFDLPFLFMTYYNVPFRQGVGPFANRMRAARMKGAIVPDLPLEIHSSRRLKLQLVLPTAYTTTRSFARQAEQNFTIQ